MSSVTETSSFDFSAIPIYLQDEILKEMTYTDFSKFEQTGKWAQAVSARNSHFSYPTDVNEFMIHNEKVYIGDRHNMIGFSFEDCRQMKFTDLKVTVSAGWLSPKTCAFLLTLGEIQTLDIPYLEFADPHTTDFFKKAKIKTLKLNTVGKDYRIEDFPIDTSNVDQVEIEGCYWLMFDVINTIKARKKVSLSSLFVNSAELLEYVERMLESGNMVDLTING